MSAIQPQFLLSAVGNIGKSIFQAGGAKFTPTTLAPKTIGDILKSFFAGLSKPKLPKIPKPSGGTKLLVGTGIAGGTILGTEVFLQTPEGQATLDTLDSSIEKLSLIGSGFGEGVENITDFFDSNPIILPLIIGLGLVLVVKS